MNAHDSFSLRREDAAKLAALRRVKTVAAAALALCVAIFVVCRIYADVHPAIAFIGAFAEAAAIGGLADWYAVVALFRRPLGLPIPHTAIIPNNQARIADNLGGFIETNFLAPETVRRKLGELDFAAQIADWLSDAKRSDALSGFVARLVPKMLEAVEGSGLRSFVAQRIADQVQRVELGPLAADVLAAFTQDRRHQKLFDELIDLISRFLTDDDAQTSLRDRIRAELPTLAKFFRADAYLLRKIVHSGASLISDIKADDDHPMRHEFDRFVDKFIENLRTSDEYRGRMNRLKQDFLARPELRALARDMWQEARTFIEKDAGAEDSTLRRHLTTMFVEVGQSLAEDPRIRSEMNEGFVVSLTSFVEAQKGSVSAFISEQVRSWDLGQLTRLIEINIGRDLQYIRFNGMLVGGLAGVALHTLEVLVLR